MSEEKKVPVSELIELLENRVVIRTATPAEITAGGIIIPKSAQRRPEQGVVVAVGPGPGAGPNGVMTCKVDDSVLFSKDAGIEIEIDGEKLLMMYEASVFLILKKKACQTSTVE